jgi:hypothetical protein
VHPLTLNNICYDFKEAKLPKNTVIFKEGDDAKNIYLVCEGEIEVYFIYYNINKCKYNLIVDNKERNFN